VIGTPGRVIDMKHRCELFNLKKLEILVLDEADTLLDMGFKESLNQILSFLPKQRRTGLFSATQTAEVKELARAGLRNPVSISVRVQHMSALTETVEQDPRVAPNGNSSRQPQATPSSLDNFFICCEYDKRPIMLARFMVQRIHEKIIVFCATCACVDYYSSVFEKMVKERFFCDTSINIVALHGKMIPKKRNGLYQRFLSLQSGVMFSTDVAARGIDIPDVDWIVQLAAPKDPAFFVHRVGRTARAGRKGGALLMVAEYERAYVELLRGRGVPLVEVFDPDEISLKTCTGYLTAAAAAAAAAATTEEVESFAKGAASNNYGSTSSSGVVGGKWKVESDHILTEMRRLASLEREVLEAGSTAFMSFVRAYKEHICSYIFQLGNLDIGSVARAYGLLRLPKIPETRGVKGKPIVFETSPISTSTIPYRHKEKEEARQRRLHAIAVEEAALETEDLAATALQGSSSLAGSDSNKPEKSGSNRNKQWIPAEEYANLDEPKRVRKKKQSFLQKMNEEWDDLAAEETAFKKFKKGKLSKDDYDKCLLSNKALHIDEETGDPFLEGDSNNTDDSDEVDDDGSIQDAKRRSSHSQRNEAGPSSAKRTASAIPHARKNDYRLNQSSAKRRFHHGSSGGSSHSGSSTTTAVPVRSSNKTVGSGGKKVDYRKHKLRR
jgi:ATP-dependent RNA helicase DDX55/SPB4